VANTPTSPLDATGKAAEDAAKKNAAEIKKRQEEIAISRAAEEELLETAVFDPKKPDAPILIDEIEEVGVSINNEKVVIRTITDIEDMTYGVGNSYTFKQGVRYSVPKDLADYLESLGYIWRAN
jgi:hypothetical protein